MGKVKLTILGSGTFVPELKRTCSSYLIENDNEKIVFDFGRGAIRNLLKLKINLYEINQIFISHMHTDHSTELASFIQFILDAPEKKNLKKEYFIYGPIGIKRDMQNMLKTFHIEKHKNLHRIKVNEIKDNLKIGCFKIKAFKVKHGKINSLSYRIEIKNKSLCYSGDSSYCEGLKHACKNVDLAIIESTAPKTWNLKNHLTGKEAGKIALESNVKNLIITHVANAYLSKVKKDVKKNYKGKVIIAKDLRRIKI
ncbi:ribonuclease Z [Candidatus Pacearchaeota archaeon]|nr:ribonuclease Z [Candidatus Pacearchaeota archaeon]